MKKLKIILISFISLILIGTAITFIVINQNSKDKPSNDTQITEDEEKIELTSSKIENNLQYHLGEKAKFKIKYTTNVDDYIINFKGSEKIIVKNETTYYIENDIIYFEPEITQKNVVSDELEIVIITFSSEKEFIIPSYTWENVLIENDYNDIDETITETKLDCYYTLLNSSIDEQEEPQKALVSDYIVVEEYYYTLEENLKPRVVIKNIGSFDANNIIQLGSNYYLARYYLTFSEIFPQRVKYGFNESSDTAGYYNYEVYPIITKENWNRCLLSRYEDYVDLSKYSHEAQDYSVYNEKGIILSGFNFENSTKTFDLENEDVIATKDEITFYDGIYENIYSIFTEKEFKYFLYWTYGLMNPNKYYKQAKHNENINFMSYTNHVKFDYCLKGNWFVANDITISNFTDETVIQKYLEGDTSIKFNEHIFNYGVYLDGLFDFNNHTIKYKNLDSQGSTSEEQLDNVTGNATLKDETVFITLGIEFINNDSRQVKFNFKEYNTFSKYATAISRYEMQEFINNYDTTYMYYLTFNSYVVSEFIQDYRYSLFALSNESFGISGEPLDDTRNNIILTGDINCDRNSSSIININYDFSETGISEELSEKLLKAVPVCATYNVGDIGNLEYV